MILKELMEKFSKGELSLDQLKEGLKAYNDEIGAALQDGGLKVKDVPGKPAKVLTTGLWLRDLYLSRLNGVAPTMATKAAKERMLSKWPVTKDMSEGGTAGYLVPEEMARELYDVIQEASASIPFVTVMPMTSNLKVVPSPASYMTAKFHKETESATEAEPTFEEKTLTSLRLDAFTEVSNECLQDEVIGVAALLTQMFGEASGTAVDSAIFQGNDSCVFSGVFSSAAGYSEVFSTGSTNFSEILAVNLINAYTKVSAAWRKGGAFFMNSAVSKYLKLEKDGSGAYLWPVYGRGGAVPMDIHGYPITESSNAPSASAAATACAVFMAPKAVILGDRFKYSVLVDPYSKAESFMTRFVFGWRLALAWGKTTAVCRIMTHA